MEKLFCDFVERAPRSKKPRTSGLQVGGDNCESTFWLKELLEQYGEYVDVVKLAISMLWTMPWRSVEERVRIYRDHNVNVLIDDPIFGIAYHQGKADQFLRAVRDTGFTHCQIDTHLLVAPDKMKKADEDEKYYHARAREIGLRLLGEVGQKWEEGDSTRGGSGTLNVEATIAGINHFLGMGCEQVFLEARVIRQVVGEYGEKEEGTRQIRQVVDAVGADKIIFENDAQLPFEVRMALRFWSVRNFGPEANMGGSDPLTELRYIEGIRQGVTYAKGPSKATPMLWIKSMAKHGGKAAPDWWKEEYPIDATLVRGDSPR